MFTKMKNLFARAGVAATGAVVATQNALAQTAPQGPDMTGLTSQVQFGTVIVAVLAVAGALALVYIAITGARIVLGVIKGA